MTGVPDRAALRAAVRDDLQRRLAALRAELAAARGGARVDGDHRPENRGERAAVTGQGYLVGALAGRVAEVEGQLRAVDALDPGPRARVGPGAWAVLRWEDGQEQVWYLAPGASGEACGARLVGLDAPAALALWGARAGDLVELPDGAEVEVVAVG